MVKDINNDCYRVYLGPLIKYKKPTDILPHIIAASTYIKNPEIGARNKFVASDNQNSRAPEKTKHFGGSQSDDESKAVTCFRCRAEGHLL